MNENKRTIFDASIVGASYETSVFFSQKYSDLLSYDLISLDYIEELLRSNSITYPSLQLARDGRYVCPSEYTHDVQYGKFTIRNQLSADAVITNYNNGATIVLNAINSKITEVDNLCKKIGNVYACNVFANVYISPPNSQGFDRHFDNHDVIVIQLDGQKKWVISENETEKFDKTVNERSILLSAGDFLYIPRGREHYARTSRTPSTHISFGLHCITWKDFLELSIDSHAVDRRWKKNAMLKANQIDGIKIFHELLASLTHKETFMSTLEICKNINFENDPFQKMTQRLMRDE
jgi:hypothetical protein